MKKNQEFIDISIIVVNYMTYEKTINTIESIFRFTENLSYEILLVDNGSKNNDRFLLEKYSKGKNNIIFIPSKTNLGFGKGNNLALKKAKGEYICFLNSDTELTANSFYRGIKFLQDNSDVGAVGPRLIDIKGFLDNGCKRGFPTPKDSLYYFLKLDKITGNKAKYGKYKLSFLSEYEIHDVDVISGAFFLTKKTILDKFGSFDENFFMYGEDIDLCYRLKKNGYRIMYNPKLGDVIHYKGESGKKRRFKTLFHFYNAMVIFYKKHYKAQNNFLVSMLVYIGIYSMFFIKLLTNFFKKG
ncbi:GT2 family glycosyltransferase [Acetoanaerobium pronyense]|uniref:GT2 family glycosyltransferase n=1 Tax=Acetoanaerobium pronyense TaxID=1482736 RepID=A0ABS4KH69_9FIRM|nr:glycosyltransferase family 2 protein [Acetoanaerobium pronyense]MBP2027132.1 GT2 family glycosyltransferase [Acetoanaerobium pronyense]